MRPILFSLIMCGAAAGSCFAQLPVSLDWSIGESLTGSHRVNNLRIINNSEDTIRTPWQLFYGSVGRVLNSQSPDFEVTQICGTHHSLSTSSLGNSIAPGDSLEVTLSGPYYHLVSFFPENPYLVATDANGKELPPMRVDFKFKEADHREMATLTKNYPDGPRVYARNARLTPTDSLSPYHIIPAVKSLEKESGDACIISGVVTIIAPPSLEKEKNTLADMLRKQGVSVRAGGTPVTLSLSKIESGENEAYKLVTGKDGIEISAPTAEGIHNGCRTLLAVLAGQTFPLSLPAATIIDYPDFAYRGLHFDVARNFTEKAEVLRLLDLMSLYKMNVLHFHLVDDEGWRLAIDGIDELTEVGSRRTHSPEESNSLYPFYGSGIDGGLTGNGFYTRDEFKEILRYATDRHIKVIPEIDVPGHSRAAIMAMNERYRRYIDSDSIKATEYLLTDFDDKSQYRSVQDYNDCVMNIALPSTYNFVKDVMTDVIKMYDEAGAPLDVIHVGGDEVPHGAWEGSPVAQAYMKEKGMDSTQQLRDEFLLRLHSFLAPQGISIGGWQEILTKGDGKEINHSLPGHEMLSYSWNTSADNDMDQLTYSLVNAGYPTVLCNVNNLYLDLSYSPNFMDPGFRWGGYVDEFTTFATNPFNIYASGVNLDDPESWQPELADGKTQLLPEGKKNIAGLQGEMWSETFRNIDMVQERMLPKVFGVAERAWNADPEWQSYDEFVEACSKYASRISLNEFDRLARLGMSYRVAPPGLMIINGELHANSPYPNAEIHYTLDGSEPTAMSPLWSAPVEIADSKLIRARAYVNDRGSVITELFID